MTTATRSHKSHLCSRRVGYACIIQCVHSDNVFNVDIIVYHDTKATAEVSSEISFARLLKILLLSTMFNLLLTFNVYKVYYVKYIYSDPWLTGERKIPSV